ncbi:unnamed protein product [Plutella xylostella]|uniref:HECT-type E3 ubiquitin transferase n=1 Tax=Plutella xylostella TaxID=51655 RepID=A0A8S4FMM2_PLUXY|nr:unnamed protein product [Plutella xylostella]
MSSAGHRKYVAYLYVVKFRSLPRSTWVLDATCAALRPTCRSLPPPPAPQQVRAIDYLATTSSIPPRTNESSISTLSGCGSPEQLERLPELPASEERRLRRAATLLQQRLVLRQWLVTHRLQHAYSSSCLVRPQIGGRRPNAVTSRGRYWVTAPPGVALWAPTARVEAVSTISVSVELGSHIENIAKSRLFVAAAMPPRLSCSELLSLDVSSLEDVYWLEDKTARHALDAKDFAPWSAARRSLPTGKEELQTLKADLWSAVVKNSRHQDAWTWVPSTGRPKTAVTQDNIDAVRQLIKEDRHVTYEQIRASLSIGMTAIQTILHEELGVKKLVSCWVPHRLTEEQKSARVNWCRSALQRFNGGSSNAVYNIVSGDESWIYSYEPERKHQSAVWVFEGGMLVVSVSVAGLVTLAAVTQPALAPEAKHSLLQYVTGKYLHPPSCKVEWGWTEPREVGDCMCFTVHCFQRNGQPYPCAIPTSSPSTSRTGLGRETPSISISTVMELGSAADPAQANTARVQFTVRTAGLYIISVMIGGVPVSGSPYRKWFVAGAVVARRSRVRLCGAALVASVGHPRRVHVAPRDQWDNPVPHTDHTVRFLPAHEPAGPAEDPKLSACGVFTYDAVNVQVTLSLTVPEPGVYRAHAAGESLSSLHLVLRAGCREDRDSPQRYRDDFSHKASDTAIVQRNISCKQHISYAAQLLATGNKRAAVSCCLTSRQLVLKEYVLKVIPRRITAPSACAPHPANPVAGPGQPKLPRGVLTVEDGAGPRAAQQRQSAISSPPPSRSCAASTAAADDSFKNKQDYFYSEACARCTRGTRTTRSPSGVPCCALLASSLKATKHLSMQDWCKNFDATKHLSMQDWWKNFDVSIQGEQGVDWGGVRREWFSLLCTQLFDGKHGLFVPFNDSPTGLVHPNPDRPPHLKLKHFELAGKIVGKCLYESALGGSYRQLVRARLTRSFLAMIIGTRVHYKSALGGSYRQLVRARLTRSFLAMIIGTRVHYKSALGGSYRQLVRARLTRSFLAMIIGTRVHYKYFEQDDPELYLSLIKYVLETDLDAAPAAELFCCDDVYDRCGRLLQQRDLLPRGSVTPVTNANKHRYLDALAQWRLCTRVRAETAAFLRGLATLIPDNLLAIFDENELELLICGSGEVSVADWKAHALVAGAGRDQRRLMGWFWAAVANFTTEERARLLQFTTGCSQLPPAGFQSQRRLMGWFWAAVANFTTEERARLLQFTTGCSQLPPAGFQELNPRFQITLAPTFGALPTAHTCFNQLCLPDYDSYEQLVRALLWAINEGGEGFPLI